MLDEDPQCTGHAAEALAIYRERCEALQRAGQRKPDMVAQKELARQWAPPRSHGEIPGVPIGLKLAGRGEAAILGIHTQILRGIDAFQGEACYAVCVSGGYVDDKDTEPDGSLIYTGNGGQKGGRQVKDQTDDAYNMSLLTSIDTQEPIRLLRGVVKQGKPEYVYDGLYRCEKYEYTASADGPMVYKFKLVPIPGLSRHSLTVVPKKIAGPHKNGAKNRLEAKLKAKKGVKDRLESKLRIKIKRARLE